MKRTFSQRVGSYVEAELAKAKRAKSVGDNSRHADVLYTPSQSKGGRCALSPPPRAVGTIR